jgi:hypothetical protein
MQKIYIAVLYAMFFLISMLVVITRGNSALVKRKIMIGILLLSVTMPGLTLVSCRSGNEKKTAVTDVWSMTGWIDENTYRARAEGVPDNPAAGIDIKKISARKRAMLNARKEIRDTFESGYRAEMASGLMVECYESTSINIAQEVLALIKSGKVITERYSPDNSSCEIIYEVKGRYLKKKVDMAQFYIP